MSTIGSELISPSLSAATQKDRTGWFVEWAHGGQKTQAGQRVSNDSALQLSTVFACIRNISEDVGKLPLKLYKTLEPRGKETLPKHAAYSLLHDKPNPEMTAVTFRTALMGHCLGWGNGFAEIERNIDGSPRALWPLRRRPYCVAERR
jgi:HK97 family phage portal protein